MRHARLSDHGAPHPFVYVFKFSTTFDNRSPGAALLTYRLVFTSADASFQLSFGATFWKCSGIHQHHRATIGGFFFVCFFLPFTF